jgi:TolA-binding protein
MAIAEPKITDTHVENKAVEEPKTIMTKESTESPPVESTTKKADVKTTTSSLLETKLGDALCRIKMEMDQLHSERNDTVSNLKAQIIDLQTERNDTVSTLEAQIINLQSQLIDMQSSRELQRLQSEPEAQVLQRENLVRTQDETPSETIDETAVPTILAAPSSTTKKRNSTGRNEKNPNAHYQQEPPSNSSCGCGCGCGCGHQALLQCCACSRQCTSS